MSQAYDPASGGTPPAVLQFDGIWDTGATNSVITQAVIDGCGLFPITMAQVHGVHGSSMEEVFLVNIHLPGNVAFPGVRVTRGRFVGGDLLIGMDIISRGDFAISNFNGLTKFSFRIPSQRHIDFYEQHQQLQKQFGKGKPKHSKKKK